MVTRREFQTAIQAANEKFRTLGLHQDVRDDPRYNEMYATLGHPTWLPKPRPFYSGGASAQRYAYCTGATTEMTLTVPAGEYGLVWIAPYQYTYPLLSVTTTSSGTAGIPATAIDWSRSGVQLDFADPIFAAFGGWRLGSPFEGIGDSAILKNGLTGSVVKTTEITPVTAQKLGGTVRGQVQVPQTGQCVVRQFTTATHPDSAGRAIRGVPLVDSYQRTHPGMLGAIHPVGLARSDVSPIGFMEQNTRAQLLTGSSQHSALDIIHHSEAHEAWHYAGHIDSTDAVAGSADNFIRGFMPRWNIAAQVGEGLWLIKNTGSVAVTAMFSYEATYAVIIETDDADSTVPFSVVASRGLAQPIKTHQPTTDIRPGSFHIDSTTSARRELVQQSMAAGLPGPVATALGEPKPATPTTHWTADVATTSANLAGAYKNVRDSGVLYDASQLLKGAWNWFTGKVAAGRAIAARAQPVVEEVEDMALILRA